MVALLVIGAPVPGGLLAQDDERAQHVYEIFRNRCFSCHGEKREAGLDLRTQAWLKAGGVNGPVVVPHQPEQSRLYLAVAHRQQPVMPRVGTKLSDEDVETIAQWIDDGASFESVEEAVAAAPGARRDMRRYEERPITPEERTFWAFQPPRRTSPGGGGHPIDLFLRAALAEKRLSPSPPADRRTLIRRASLDLLGLPPTAKEIDEFVGDPSPDAWPRLVDRLLASPHYGERWARHWLDLVRYADSGGFEFDTDRPQAWRYRDYVVNAFNNDKPYDRFIREQIAGDEFASDSDEAMIATGNGYMPAAYQGTQFRDTGDPIVDLKPPTARTPDEQRKWLRLVHELNERHASANPADTELAARIHSYELAFRMQTHAPEAIDISKESDATKKLYGVGEQPTDYFARQVLMARRLVERGVRHVQIFSGGGNFEPSWDAHWDLKANHGLHCAETDKPIAGLIKDLKSRGMFDSTLILWHGEFGRLPISERLDGRDHSANGFSVWLAGGGVKGGTIVGATDQYGYNAIENKKSVYELHATIQHLLGLDYQKLTYRFNGRDMRLTDVHGKVVKEILA